MRYITLLIACFLFLFSLSPSYSSDKGLFDAVGIQKLRIMAPDLLLSDLDGRQVSLKEYRGKVVFLHFWATWCKPCMEEMPTLEKMHREFKNTDIVILAVSVDRSGIDTVRAYVKEFTFTVLVSFSGNVNNGYLTWGIPVSYIIDRNGGITGRAIGPRDWNSDNAKELIKKILSDLK